MDFKTVLRKTILGVLNLEEAELCENGEHCPLPGEIKDFNTTIRGHQHPAGLGFSLHHDHGHRMEWAELCKFAESGADLTLTAQRIYFQPYIARFQQTINDIGWINANPVQGNVKVGVYDDNGDTPVGGALLQGSAAIAQAGANQKQEGALTSALQVDPGLYWLAILAQAGLQGAYTTPWWRLAYGGTLRMYRADIASDDLPATAPSVTEDNDVPTMYALVSAVP